MTTTLRRILSVIRLKPFDTSSESGRASERYRRVAMTWFAAVGSRGVNLLTTLVSVPLTKSYLGNERYGLWMVISSTIATFSFVDLGMGSGLMNALAAADGRDDRAIASKYVSSALFTLATICGALLALFVAIYPFVPWAELFKANSPLAAREVGPAVLIFVTCFLSSMVLSIIPRIQSAYQEGFASGIWQSAGNLASLIAVLTVIGFKLGLPWLVLAMAGAPAAMTVLNGITLFAKRPWLRPRLSVASRSAARAVLSVGFLFLVSQIAGSLAYLSDNFVAEQLFGNEQVTPYSVTYRLFMLPTMFVSVAFGPLWPAYCEAIARHDVGWVKRTFTRSLKIGLTVGLPVAVLMTIFHQPLLRLWRMGDIVPSTSLTIGMACWMFLFVVNYPISMLFNGLNVVKFQAVTASIMAVVNIILSVILGKWIGLSGIIWGTVIAYTLCEALPRCIFLPKFLRQLSEAKPVDSDPRGFEPIVETVKPAP